LDGIQVVYHLAAYQDYLTDFSTFFRTNSVGTALLYELIVTERRRVDLVVVGSSQAVYGEGCYACRTHGVLYPDQRPLVRLEQRLWDHLCPDCGDVMTAQWTDETEMKPHNAYALSKRDQDDIARIFGERYGVPSVAFRYSIVQGPRQSFRNAYSGALRAFVVCALSGAAPVCFEDGEQLRDYVSVHDVVAANLLPLDRPNMVGKAFNVGGGRRVTVRELAAMVVEKSGSRLSAITPGLYRVGDTRHVFSDVAALNAFGWSVRVGQQEIVEEYIRWASAQPDLVNTYKLAEERMRALGVLRSVRDVSSPH
jgi:dTDP-L-rhamnose 4-epimerase